MGIASPFSRAHFERGSAHFERRSPQAASAVVIASASTTLDVAQATVAPVAKSGISSSSSASVTGGLIIALGFVALLLAFAIWKLVSSMRRRTAIRNLADGKQTGFASKMDLEASFETVEKPHTAFLRPVVAPVSSGVGWVPQIKSELAIPAPTKARSDRAKQAWEKNLAEFMAPPVPTAPTHNGALISAPLPAMPPVPASRAREVMSPTPPAYMKSAFTAPTLPNVAPAPNPFSAPAAVCEQRFPRLMDVATAFTHSLNDEISITLGETVRLLEEFEDDWCLVQRVGRKDAPHGVIPRFCLVERPQIVHKGSLRRGDALSS